MKTLKLALLIAVLLPAMAQAVNPPKDVASLLDKEEQLNDKCRGGTSESEVTKACNERDKIFNKLKAKGWCWGNGSPDQIEADKVWQKCKS